MFGSFGEIPAMAGMNGFGGMTGMGGQRNMFANPGQMFLAMQLAK